MQSHVSTCVVRGRERRPFAGRIWMILALVCWAVPQMAWAAPITLRESNVGFSLDFATRPGVVLICEGTSDTLANGKEICVDANDKMETPSDSVTFMADPTDPKRTVGVFCSDASNGMDAGDFPTCVLAQTGDKALEFESPAIPPKVGEETPYEPGMNDPGFAMVNGQAVTYILESDPPLEPAPQASAALLFGVGVIVLSMATRGRRRADCEDILAESFSTRADGGQVPAQADRSSRSPRPTVVTGILCILLWASPERALAIGIDVTEASNMPRFLTGIVIGLKPGTVVLCEGEVTTVGDAKDCDSKGVSDRVVFLNDPVNNIMPQVQIGSDFDPKDENNPDMADSTFPAIKNPVKFIPEKIDTDIGGVLYAPGENDPGFGMTMGPSAMLIPVIYTIKSDADATTPATMLLVGMGGMALLARDLWRRLRSAD